MTADTERLVKFVQQIDEAFCLDDPPANDTARVTFSLDQWWLIRAALLSTAEREGEIERLRAVLSDLIDIVERQCFTASELPDAVKVAKAALSAPAPARTEVAAAEGSHEPDKPIEQAYLTLLRLPFTSSARFRLQTVFCTLRDEIAAATNRDPESVQNEFEVRAFTPPATPTAPPDFIDTIAMDTACKIFGRAPNAADDVTRAKALIAGALLRVIAEHDRRAGAVREGWDNKWPTIPTPRLSAALEDSAGTKDPDWYAKALIELAGWLGLPNDFYYPLLGAAQELRRQRAKPAASPLPGEQGDRNETMTGDRRL